MGPEPIALTSSQLDPVSDVPSDETIRRADGNTLEQLATWQPVN
jgi:hypothetical protein